MSVSKINFNDKNEAYIIVDPISEIDKNEFKKYLNLDSPSFLTCEFENEDVFTLFYSYEDRISLKQFLARVIDKSTALGFLKSLVNVFIEAEKYELNQNHILLNIQSVFYNEETGQVSCIYVPVEEGILPVRPLRLFLKEILVNMLYSEEDDMTWLGNVIRYLSHHRQLDYLDFYTFLQLQETVEAKKIEEAPVIPIVFPEADPVDEVKKVLRNVPEDAFPETMMDEQEDKIEESEDEKYFLYRRSNHSKYFLKKEDMRIGKAADNEIAILDNPVISRVHAVISYIDDEYVIQDNDSTNHTFINGIVLNPGDVKVLKMNDRILLGNEELIFKEN